MIKPMLAVPMTKGTINNWNEWAIEEKFDGHRLIVEVAGGDVTAWTRPRKHAGDVSGKSMNERVLPPHLAADLARLPEGVYDGELLGGDTSTDVTRTDLAHTLRFVVFDFLRDDAIACNAAARPYDERRRALEYIFGRYRQSPVVTLARSCPVTCEQDVTAFVDAVWARGGEGAILKRRAAAYQPGKRSPDFIKVKKLLTTVCTIVGFETTRGKVLSRGAYATVLLEDAEGNRTSVKTLNDAELDAFNNEWREYAERTDVPMRDEHPAIGRKLRIEYQDWTPKGGYRHPRWDRWEDE